MSLLRGFINSVGFDIRRYNDSNNLEVYNLPNQRGRAIILDNETFQDNPDLTRAGNTADVREIYSLLRSMKF